MQEFYLGLAILALMIIVALVIVIKNKIARKKELKKKYQEIQKDFDNI